MNKKITKFIAFSLIFIGVFIVTLAFRPWYSNILNPIPTDIKINNNDISNDTIIKEGVATYDISSTSTKRLINPAIGVDIMVISSDNQDEALKKGAWHMINSGTPDNPEGYNNIVIGGHRFLYTSGPKTFYNLDKLQKDDLIFLHWLGQEYKYKVEKTYIVQPENVNILKDAPSEKLTLFTCNPIYSTKERLVIDAYPVEF